MTTQKVKAAVEAQIADFKLKLALHWTPTVSTDVPVPTMSCAGAMTLATGWMTGGGFEYGRVEVACSSSVCHSFGHVDQTNSQGARPLYSTRLKALQALRNEIERAAAMRLLRLDLEIEAEEKSPTPLPAANG
jgi:hypothetical protein